MTKTDLEAWMRKNGYVDSLGRPASGKLSEDMGVHRSAVLKWLSGEHKIDRRTELALEAIEWRAREAARRSRAAKAGARTRRDRMTADVA